MGHVVAPDLASAGRQFWSGGACEGSGPGFVRRAIPAVLDLVLVLGLSRYSGVPIPHGTDIYDWIS
jgi:hypothetical protein